LTGIASMLACHFDFGISSSSTSTPQNQVTTQGGASGSTTQATGASSTGAAGSTGSTAFAPVTVNAGGGGGATVVNNTNTSSNNQLINSPGSIGAPNTAPSIGGTGGGGASGSGLSNQSGAQVSLNQSVNYYNADAQTTQTALQGLSDVAGYSIQAEGQTAANALTFGLGAESTALAAGNQAQNNAFGFGAEVVNEALASNNANSQSSLNDVASFANAGLQSANDIASSAIASNAAIGSELSAITASAVPLNSANTPANTIGAEAVAGGAGADKFNTYLWIGIGLISLYVFTKTGGRST
jgi:hypothetical protein